MKFLTNKQTAAEVKKLFENASEGMIAVAFWGNNALSELGLAAWKGKKPLQIVCNLESGASNPNEIEKMMEAKNIEVRSHPKLHAKVYWTNKGCVISSANASANGLGYEGKELDGWIEAGSLVTDPKILAEIKKWFLNDVWKEENKIGDDMIKEAKELWGKKRASRPVEGLDEKLSLLENARKNPDNLRGKIIVTTYEEEEPSDKALEVFNKIGLPASYTFYENWEVQKDMIILDIGYDLTDKKSKGLPRFDALWLVYGSMEIDKKHSITIVEEIKNFEDCKKLSKQDKEKFERMTIDCIEDFKKKGKDTSDIAMDFVEFVETYQSI